MISVHYPSKKPKFLPYVAASRPIQQQTSYTDWWERPAYVAKAANLAAKMNPPITTEEWIRRDKIVFARYSECKFKPGDFAVPADPHNYNQMGRVYITGIASSYEELKHDDWDKDNPYIISAQTIPEDQTTEQPYRFVCTTPYLSSNLTLHDTPEE